LEHAQKRALCINDERIYEDDQSSIKEQNIELAREKLVNSELSRLKNLISRIEKVSG